MDESLVGLLRKSYKLLLADNMYLASYDSCNDIDLYGIENLCYCYGITGSITSIGIYRSLILKFIWILEFSFEINSIEKLLNKSSESHANCTFTPCSTLNSDLNKYCNLECYSNHIKIEKIQELAVIEFTIHEMVHQQLHLPQNHQGDFYVSLIMLGVTERRMWKLFARQGLKSRFNNLINHYWIDDPTKEHIINKEKSSCASQKLRQQALLYLNNGVYDTEKVCDILSTLINKRGLKPIFSRLQGNLK